MNIHRNSKSFKQETFKRLSCLLLITCFISTAALAEDPPALKLKTTKQEIKKLILKANRSQTPTDALALYRAFIDAHNFTTTQRETLKSEIRKWLDYQDKNLVRNGKKWITEAENEQLAKEADALVNQAIELIKIGNDREATDLLEEASKKDRNALRADFILGLLNSPLINNAPKKSIKHFQQVVLRDPDNVAALNNLALAQIRNRKNDDAIKSWKKALELTTEPTDITHNIGYFIAEANDQCIRLKPSTMKKASRLYAEAVTADKGKRLQDGVGWVYSQLVLPEKEQPVPEPDQDEEPPTLVASKESDDSKESSPIQSQQRNFRPTGAGSGFVIQDQYLITNNHVVYDNFYGLAGKVTVVKQGAEMEAKIVATSKELDLAILKVNKLNLPPLKITDSKPRLASEIAVLGFPQTGVLGDSIKTTMGSVSGHSPRLGGNLLLYDAVTNPGNSGGPVCNQYGQVIAVHAQGLGAATFLNLNSGKLGAGIPMNEGSEFIQKHVPEFKPVPLSEGPKNEWPDIVETAVKSTVIVKIYRAVLDIEVPITAQASPDKPNQKQNESNTWVDNSCNFCHGTGYSECPQRGCIKGRVSSVEGVKRLVKTKISETIVTDYRKKFSKCSTCNGTDRIKCPFCK